MGDLDNTELLYIAGIGLFVNILLFATTLLISVCRSSSGGQNTDVEALHENDDDLNVRLLQDAQEETSLLKIADIVPTRPFSSIEKTGRVIGCSICLKDGFEDEDVCRVLPGCGHVFHGECIDQWLKLRCSCPVCRMDFRTLVVQHLV